MKRLSLILALLILNGCVTYSLVKPGTVKIGDAYRAQPRMEWSRLDRGRSEAWTIDGNSLHAVEFIKGLEDGEILFQPAAGKSTDNLPKYRKGMNPLEIQDLISNSLKAIGGLKLEVEELRPVKLNGVDAFRSELTYTLKDGLIRRAIAVSAVKNEKLYVLFYYAVKQHYFGKYRDDIERLFQSIEIL